MRLPLRLTLHMSAVIDPSALVTIEIVTSNNCASAGVHARMYVCVGSSVAFQN